MPSRPIPDEKSFDLQNCKEMEEYLPLVHRVARHMASSLPSFIQLDELVSLGTLGLVEAARRYQADEGVSFETYAVWRIRGAILDGLRRNDWIPRDIRKQAREIEQAYAFVEGREQRAATEEEICEYLGISPQELHRRLAEIQAGTVLSLEQSLSSEEEESSLMDVLADPRATDPYDEARRKEIARILAAAIERLPEKEKLVITLYYYEELTLREIAEVLELTPSRISQLHTKAICRLRGSLSRKKKDL
jgi:RNA polymerase sigma factor for flagellar operon FliA